MFQFKRKYTLGKSLLLFLLGLIALFFFVESVLPLENSFFVFKSAYDVQYSLPTKKSPSSIVFDKAEYQTSTNKSLFIKFKIEGEEGCSRQIICSSDNESIATVCSTSFEEIIVTGVSAGKTKINVFSSINNQVFNSVYIDVIQDKPISFDGISQPVPCYTIDNKLIYQTNVIIDYNQDLKLNYVVKNSSNTVISTKLQYNVSDDCDDVIDKNGNIYSNAKCVGKSLLIEVFSKELQEKYGLQSIVYTVKINYPPDYGSIYLSSFFNTFFIYILSFGLFGFIISEIVLLFVANEKKAFILSCCISLVVSLIILLLQFFALSRTFEPIYWVVAPLTSLILLFFTNNFSRNKFFERIKKHG